MQLNVSIFATITADNNVPDFDAAVGRQAGNVHDDGQEYADPRRPVSRQLARAAVQAEEGVAARLLAAFGEGAVSVREAVQEEGEACNSPAAVGQLHEVGPTHQHHM